MAYTDFVYCHPWRQTVAKCGVSSHGRWPDVICDSLSQYLFLAWISAITYHVNVSAISYFLITVKENSW